ncbi:methionine import ATP-binding protein MetN 1 [Halolactibacillus miurensis]|uniref:D-methionine transport system ATP-binding protein n=1 Tax=Halolactibacillus miurensis TaxID=306541 RepID=A0A1I6PA85_9BACI|nr:MULTISPECIES: ATP-binding cassette domain-containing protein [Halolactibacillus]GEM03020.1 methionine import ATP-binding protein MetN 1 [Halolactibacillus miurensis]SFS37114.1 D-methionine transport system ATP-binding protein [Halolactibacillus miurensis]
MIELKHITKVFKTGKSDVKALDDVSLTVEKGEIFGVIGYSGAGKSTLVRMANLLEEPTSGDVIIDSDNLVTLSKEALRKKRQRIGMIFQGFNLLKTLTVYQNIAIPLKLTGVAENEIKTRVKKYLEIVGLSDKTDVYPNQLSGGQKQRVAIARALSHEPDILLSDEATSALDPDTTDQILELLLKINRELGITILLITHEMHVIQRICDRVAVMENGKIIEQGPVVDLYTEPKHQTTRRFVESIFPSQTPKHIIKDLQKEGPILDLTFVGSATESPSLSVISNRYQIETNILSGNIVELKDQTFGKLRAHIKGSVQETTKSIDYLTDQGVIVREVVIHDGIY